MEPLRQPVPAPVPEPKKPVAPTPPELTPEASTRWPHWSVWVLLTLVLGSLTWVLIERSKAPAASTTAATRPTAKATIGDLQRTIRVSGMIGAKDFAPIVAPRLRGRFDRGGPGGGGDGGMILIKLAKPGSRVEKGDVIAEFDRQSQLQRIEDQQAEVIQAEAAIVKRRAELAILREASMQGLRQAKADMDKARLDLKTLEIRSEIDGEKMKLAADETAARHKQIEQEVQLLEKSHAAEIRALEIRKERAKLDKTRAEMNAEKMVMRAPIGGMVVMQTSMRNWQAKQIQEGDQVGPGQYFLQIVNPVSMILQGSVNQAESQEFRLGQAAEIRLDAYPGQAWRGRLISVGAMAGGESGGRGGPGRGVGTSALYVRRIPVRFSVESKDPRIIPDLSASANVILREETKAVLVPIEAVERESDGAWVHVRKADGGWERRRVELGLTSNTHAAVRGGLRAGEEVALERPAQAGL